MGGLLQGFKRRSEGLCRGSRAADWQEQASGFLPDGG